jgi:hypothetical protein
MERGIIMTTSIRKAVRGEKRARTLGENPRCGTCGETTQAALVTTDDGIRCYECHCQDQGKATTEAHHHLGRAIDPSTVAIPGNIHRALSESQRDRPKDARQNPERDPLRWIAAGLSGLHDHLAWWLDWLTRLATWFLQLAEALRAQQWWEALGIARVWEVQV